MLRPVLLSALVLVVGCSRKPKAEGEAPMVSSASVASEPQTRVPPVSAAPASDFADAAPADGKTAFEQAQAYEANGQHWLARLLLEKKALGSSGTPAEQELLATICHEQGDDECVEACAARLGRKLDFPSGPARARPVASEHREPDSDLARARDLVLKRRLGDARKVLEAKVLDGSASREEARLLRSVCQQQGDRMCVALCETKLK